MLLCKFCQKECKNKNSLSNHERCCTDNPNRNYKNGMLGKKGSNHWIKAKETGIPYELKDSSRQKWAIASKNRGQTEETKRKISEKRKAYLELNPDKVPYLLNHSSEISYPEQYFLNCFSELTNVKFQHPVHRYKLDFANINEKIYFEVDGEQHYLDKRIVNHDIIRCENLLRLGWKGIRIRWSHFQKLSDIEKKQELERIISELKFV